MDVLKLFADQERQGFPDLAGSEAHSVIRLTERILNAIITEQLQGSESIRELHITPHAGNRLTVRVDLAKPAFLPAFTIEVRIDKQPALPGDPVLGLTLSGIAGLLRFAGPAVGFFKVLPPFVRMEGERVFVDLRAALAPRGLTTILDYVKDVAFGAEEGHLVVAFSAAVRG